MVGQARVIVVGNEKGGAGKSTIAIHTATALLHADAKVAVLDLDLRQQSTAHFFANRRAWLDANGVAAPMPIEHPLSADGAALSKGCVIIAARDSNLLSARDSIHVHASLPFTCCRLVALFELLLRCAG